MKFHIILYNYMYVQYPKHSRSLKPPEALSSGTDLSMAKRELQVLRDAQEGASQRVQAQMGKKTVGNVWKMLGISVLMMGENPQIV